MLVLVAVLILGYFIAQVFSFLTEYAIIAQARGALPEVLSFVIRHSNVMFVLTMLLLCVVAFFAVKKWPILKSHSKTALVIGHLLLYGAIFVSYGKFETLYATLFHEHTFIYWGIPSYYPFPFNLSFFNSAFVFAIALLSAFFIPTVLDAPFMQKYFTRKYLIGIGFVSAYAAFAALGDSLFWQEGLSPVTLSVYLMGTLWLFPMALQLLALCERLSLRLKARMGDAKTRSYRFVWLTTFCVFVGIWLVYLIIFNPALMSNDSLGMWRHATRGEPIGYYAFPTIVIFMVRILTYIIPHPMFIAFTQIVFFAVLGSFFMLEFYKRGLSLRFIYIFTGVFAALLPNALMIITLWSNIPFTLSMLYLTYAIIRLFAHDRGKIIPYVNITLALALTYCTRSEGVIPAVICAAFLLFISFWKKFNAKFLAATVMGCVLIFLITGPLYSAIRADASASPHTSHSWVICLDGIQGVMYYGGNLPPETMEFMETIMPRDEWIENYGVYDFDLSFRNSLLKLAAENEGFTQELRRHYLRTFANEPFLLIKTRLSTTDMMWNLTPPMQSAPQRVLITTISENVGFPHREFLAASAIIKYIHYATIIIAPLDSALNRSGIYIILALLLCVFLIVHKSYKMTTLFLPMAGGILALLIAMGWPVFRNVWFIPVIFAFAVPIVLLDVANLERAHDAITVCTEENS